MVETSAPNRSNAGFAREACTVPVPLAFPSPKLLSAPSGRWKGPGLWIWSRTIQTSL
ncbi:unnamed protein product [Durusdinium trenchii]|uniref:Uncharacterized protein n=1 Tax=Durusdinium trenchii TaxID=1381693 RepID=A0ABP0MPQ0_9DINO